MALVELHDVTFTYPNDFTAVDGVSFSIQAGESVAIVGQNGAGKTTTVKMINGLTKPTTGMVTIDGVDTRTRTSAQTARHVGYVFQNPDDQIFNPTVIKEVGYGLKRTKLAAAEVERRAKAACELVGLGHALDENPYDLPLSIRKFVTIASVIAADPAVMIFDEPTAGQDLVGLDRLAYVIGELQKAGKAIITITHDMEFVAQNFDRMIVMANKQLIADGRVDEVFYDQPTMDQAHLKPPALVSVARLVGGSELGLDVDAIGRALVAAR